MQVYTASNWGNVEYELTGITVGRSFGRFVLTVNFRLKGPDSARTEPTGRMLTGLSGSLHSGNNEFVGLLHPSCPTVTIWGGRSTSFSMAAYLDAATFEALEAQRNGGNSRWNVRFWGVIHHLGEVADFTPAMVSLNVPHSDWLNTLTTSGWARWMLIEVPVPNPPADPNFARAADFLAQAQTKIANGEYRGAVAHCREAIEALCEAKGDPGSVHFPVAAGDLFAHNDTKTKEERFQLIRAASKVITHPAHHGKKHLVEYTRADARAVVTIVAALIAQASEMP